jgi:hypothetical protein
LLQIDPRNMGARRSSSCELIERAQDRTVHEVRRERHLRSAAAVVERQKPRRLQLSIRCRAEVLANHPRVHGRNDGHADRQHEQPVHKPDSGAEPPRGAMPAFEGERVEQCDSQPFIMCTRRPNNIARSRLGVTIVPSRNGMLIRE